MATSAAFWNRISRRYARAEIGNPEAYEHKLALTRACFSPASEVLEVGCGTGSTALLHAPFVRRILATDFSRGMIDIARERATESGLDNVHFEVLSVEDIAAREERFDVALALNLLHLVEDLDAAIDAIGQVLKPGGVLVASTACIADTLPFMRYILPIGRWLGLVPYVQIISEQQLAAALVRHGFSIEHRYQPDSGRAPAVFHVARLDA